MYAIMNSCFSWLMNWLVKLGGLATIVTTILTFVLTAGISLILPMIPGVSTISDKIGSLDGRVMWFLDLFQVPTCLTIVFGFLVARFVLRRIPFIG
ncbi:DUF2523 family protein [Sphingomonas oryzagri]